MFPEIRERIAKMLGGLSDAPISLDLKGGWAYDAADYYQRNGFYKLAALSGYGSSSWAGEPISAETAQNHSVVWACDRIISESVAFLPLNLQQQKGEDKIIATKHPAQALVHDGPNDEMTAMTFRETRTSHCVLRGNGYAQIIRRSGTGSAVELRALNPDQVTPDRETSGEKRLVYVVKEGNDQPKTYTVKRDVPQDILHLRGFGFDGMQGYSVIQMARQSIGTAIAMERNVARFYANGGRLPYNLKLAKVFDSDQVADKFRADWEAIYSQPHRAPILPPWLDYAQTGLSAHDSQLIESRSFSIPEICRWFLISPHLVGDLSRATFSNIEQLALQFVKMTLSSWLTRWEQELKRCVLTPEERSQGYFFKHNLDALLRGDFATRMAGYASALQNGHLNVNEVRDYEDLNPIEGGGDYHIQLNMQTLPGGTPTASQAASLIKIGSSKQSTGGQPDA